MSYYAKNPRVFLLSILRKINFLFSDRLYIQFVYYLEMGKWPNLSNPQTFNEKLQWLKLYNRRPEYSTMVDKYAVKEYVANIIGDEYIIPTLGVWDKPEQIDWDALPNQFVLKTTHGGGNTGVVICRNKQTLDKKKAIDKLNRSLKEDIYRILREWPYKNVKPRILAEKYIEPRPDIKDLPDYKFFCFNGEPKYCQVITGRGTKMSVDFFDKEWNHQSFQEPDSYPFADVEPSKPEHLEKMWAAAAKLAEGIPFSRIDFYDVQENVYFGEITFYPTSGMGRFRPDQYNKILGKMISIPGEKWGG